MALLLTNKTIFLHVPKTGGSWVTQTLTDLQLVRRAVSKKHADQDHFRFWIEKKSFDEKYNFSFCFVRNPVVWYESWFRYMSQRRLNWRSWGKTASGNMLWHPNYMLNGLGSQDFNEFMRNVVNYRPGYATEMMGWFAKPPISFIGKQENIRHDLIDVLSRTNARFDESHILEAEPVLKSRPLAIEWDPALKEEVVRLEYAGLVRYGYDVEETIGR